MNKSTLLERIAELVRDKQIEGIADLRDESDRDGMRIVIELKRDATAEVVLNQLFRFTQLQTSFRRQYAGAGQWPAAADGRCKDMIDCFIAFREEVILRRTRFDLAKARDRAHLLVGLAIAVANIDEIIRIIRARPDAAAARAALMARDWPAADVAPLLALIEDPATRSPPTNNIRLTDAQARGILDLRLPRLTGLERDKIQAELTESPRRSRTFSTSSARAPPLEVHARRTARRACKIATPRRPRSRICETDQDDESLIEPGQMVVTITRDGFIKRMPLETFRAQNRGGRGRSAHGDARRRFRDAQLQRAHASVRAVLLLRRQGVPRKGLAPAASHAAGARAGR